MALFLNEDDVRRLLTMPIAIEAVEEAHRELSLARAIDVPRQRTRLPQTALHILQGALPGRDAIGYKAYTSNRSGTRFLMHVFCAGSGALRAVLAANFLGMMRTGAASGVATRHLARPEAEVMGLFGAGWQAEGNLMAVAEVRKLRKVKVYARNAESRAAFCAKMSDRLGIEVVSAPSPKDAVHDCDIVNTVTTAVSPLFDAAWLSPGTHINAAGSNSLIRREIGEDTLRLCRPIVVDSIDTALREAGDLLPLLEKGRLGERQLVELGDVLLGRHPGRQAPEDITLFESQGLAIQDLSVAVRLEAMAREQGLGVEWPHGD